MTPEQIAEAGQRLARLHELYRTHPALDVPVTLTREDAAAFEVIQHALREWVPREDREDALLAARRAGIYWADNVENVQKAHGPTFEKARRLLKLEDTPDV